MRKTSDRMLIKIAQLYYKNGLTQEQIAEKTKISRSRISRLLKRAQEEGIIEVHIKHPCYSYTQLEERLEKKYNLLEVGIVPDDQTQSLKVELGKLGSKILGNRISNGTTIGVAAGNTVQEVINNLEVPSKKDITVVQMTGSLTQDLLSIGANELSRRMAGILKSKLHMLNAPVIVDNKTVRDAILSDTHTKLVFEEFKKVNLALFGIGSIYPEVSSSLIEYLMDYRSFPNEQVQHMVRTGVVADICSSFIDKKGRKAKTVLDDRIIAIPLDILKSIPVKIAVAGGIEKTDAIRAALLGRYVDVLITDLKTAELL